jgi:alkanesulfonate monooxygenase SsuD/methylene tetrahydromethanopterin reductase-like flavin-dependent oxidoreductase (luciferase family)
VILGPLRMNAALLAKQILSLDALAGGGRAVLGIALGAREDDYEVSGASMSSAAPGSMRRSPRSAGCGKGRA